MTRTVLESKYTRVTVDVVRGLDDFIFLYKRERGVDTIQQLSKRIRYPADWWCSAMTDCKRAIFYAALMFKKSGLDIVFSITDLNATVGAMNFIYSFLGQRM